MSGGGGGGGGQNTTVQSVQIPQYEQDFSYANQQMAQALSNQPYPNYQGPLIQQFSPQQIQGMNQAGQAATAYQPDLSRAEGATQQGWAGGSGVLSSAMAADPASTVGKYMSPYVAQALQPQITALQTQLGQQQNAINAQATQANAFGDARQGAQQALQNFYGNQALSGLVGQGYNTAYGQALQTGLGEQQTLGQLGATYGNLGLQAGQQMASLGGLQQSLGITGANALYNAGQQQQTQGQQELNAAYQQYLNQVNWPFQMLSMRESALSNSPYNMVNATTLPQANTVAQSFGAGVGALGSLGALLSGGGSTGGGNAPFGGTQMPSPH